MYRQNPVGYPVIVLQYHGCRSDVHLVAICAVYYINAVRDIQLARVCVKVTGVSGSITCIIIDNKVEVSVEILGAKCVSVDRRELRRVSRVKRLVKWIPSSRCEVGRNPRLCGVPRKVGTRNIPSRVSKGVVSGCGSRNRKIRRHPADGLEGAVNIRKGCVVRQVDAQIL